MRNRPEAVLRRLSAPETLLALLVFLILAVLVGLPLWQLVWGSFHSGAPFDPGALTLANYRAIFSDPLMPTLVSNTLIFAATSTAMALMFGVPLAWLIVRTDLPGARFFQYATLTVLLIPVLIGAIAWSILLAPNSGLINVLILEPLLGWRFNSFSMAGMAWVQSLYMMPVVYVLVAAAFQRADPEMEHAARLAGATRLRSFFGISLAVARPTILSAAVIVFVIGIESIEIPLIFGFPGRIFVVAGDVYRALRIRSPVEWGLASALSVLLIVAVTVIFLGYVWLTRQSQRFVTVSGRGRSAQPIRLGHWRWPVFGSVLGFFGLVLFLPLLAVIYTSVVDFLGQPSIELLRTASIKHYVGIAQNPLLFRATQNSLILAVGAGGAALALSTLIAVLSIRFPSGLSKLNDAGSLMPLAVPSIALASAVLWAYIQLPFGIGRALFGSLWIMGLAYIIKFLPLATRQISSQLVQVAPELEQASRLSGANSVRTTYRVTVPLLSPALTGAFFLAFVLFFREFSVSILLFQAGSEVFSVALFDMFTSGQLGQVAGVTVIFIFSIFALMALASRYLKGFSIYGSRM